MALLLAQVLHRYQFLASTRGHPLPSGMEDRCLSLIKTKDVTYNNRILGWEGPPLKGHFMDSPASS